MTLLSEALKVGGIKEQHGIASVGNSVIHNLSPNGPASMQTAFAEGLLAELGISKLSPSRRLVPTASAASSGAIIYQSGEGLR